MAILRWAKMRHPAVEATLRDYDTARARLKEVLVTQPYLFGLDYRAAPFA